VTSGALFYSKNPEVDRAFFRDILGLRFVDAANGWLILARPPTEVRIDPGSGDFVPLHGHRQLLGAVLYPMCENLSVVMESPESRNVACSRITEEPCGWRTSLRLPSGGEIGLYQPSHPTAIEPTLI